MSVVKPIYLILHGMRLTCGLLLDAGSFFRTLKAAWRLLKLWELAFWSGSDDTYILCCTASLCFQHFHKFFQQTSLVCLQKESFQMYECYCQNKPRSEALWRQFSDCAFFLVSPPFLGLLSCKKTLCVYHISVLYVFMFMTQL